jgi:hypothetical protein
MVRTGSATARILSLGTFTAFAVLAACGGGGGSAGAPPRVSATASPAGTTTQGLSAKFSITIPNGAGTSATARKAKTISTSTTSVLVTLLKSDSTTFATPVAFPQFDVSSTSALCTTGATGRTCALSFAAPAGNDIFTIDTFDVNGHKLGSGAVLLDVLLNAANTASVTIGGPLAAVTLFTPSQVSLSTLGTASARIYLFAFDASGNPIVVPDTFTTPIMLSVTDPEVLSSNARHALDLTLPTDPANLLTASVTYAFPGAGAPTATTAVGSDSIAITSPSDVVMLNAQPFISADQFQLTVNAVAGAGATIPGSSLTSTSSITVSVSGTKPTPPAPTANLAWTSNDVRFSPDTGSGASFQFLSGTDAPVSTLSVQEATPYTGNITFTVPSTCNTVIANAVVAPFANPTIVAASGNSATFPQVFPLVPSASPPPGPDSCTITATDANTPALSATITIFVNSLTGTVN